MGKGLSLVLGFGLALGVAAPVQGADPRGEDDVQGELQKLLRADSARSLEGTSRMGNPAAGPPYLSPSETLLAHTVDAARAERPPIGRDFWPMVAAQTALTITDIEITQARFRASPYWRERNPLLPRHPSRARMYVQFAAQNVAADYAAYRLRRAGHPRWARVVQWVNLSGYVWGISWTLAHKPIAEPVEPETRRRPKW